jgi:hypothetical protein
MNKIVAVVMVLVVIVGLIAFRLFQEYQYNQDPCAQIARGTPADHVRHWEYFRRNCL